MPDFKLYYNVAQIRTVWIWSQPYIESYTPSWINIEQNLCHSLPLKSLKYIGDIEDIGRITKKKKTFSITTQNVGKIVIRELG